MCIRDRDSPDQGANGIKTQTTSFNDSTLIIQIPVIHASYKGKLNSEDVYKRQHR